MGSLILPTSGLVYLDTNPVIYSVEKHPVYWPLLQPLWQAAKAKTIEIVSSDLTLMETLIGPLKARTLPLPTPTSSFFNKPKHACFPSRRPFCGKRPDCGQRPS